MKVNNNKNIPFNSNFQSRWHAQMSICGFTIAEIIIVLSIIGIIAQVTLPELIGNVQESIWKNAAKEAYSKASQAVQQMRMEDGGTLNGYVDTTRSFKPVFMKHFKVMKDCGDLDCISSTNVSNVYKTLNNAVITSASGYYIDDGQFITTDGMFWAIENDWSVHIILITVDVNGYNKKPNVYGRDVFMFEIRNDNLIPEGAENTRYDTAGYCNKSVGTAFQGLGCMYNVMQGIDY